MSETREAALQEAFHRLYGIASTLARITESGDRIEPHPYVWHDLDEALDEIKHRLNAGETYAPPADHTDSGLREGGHTHDQFEHEHHGLPHHAHRIAATGEPPDPLDPKDEFLTEPPDPVIWEGAMRCPVCGHIETHARHAADHTDSGLRERFEEVARAIWPEGPANGHGSNAYAILRDEVLALATGEPPDPLDLEALTMAVHKTRASNDAPEFFVSRYRCICGRPLTWAWQLGRWWHVASNPKLRCPGRPEPAPPTPTRPCGCPLR